MPWSFFPKDDRILFTRDQGGNELNHLYVLKDGQERDLTPGEKLKAQFGGWTLDGSGFFVVSNERDARYLDIYRYDSACYERLQRDRAASTIRGSSKPSPTTVKKNGAPVEYVVFADEGHGFTKKKNQIEGYSAVLKFLDTHLRGKASGTK